MGDDHRREGILIERGIRSWTVWIEVEQAEDKPVRTSGGEARGVGGSGSADDRRNRHVTFDP
jgi:hypothetical protein